nr:hypothetical protein [uncultured Methanoregula sp.]
MKKKYLTWAGILSALILVGMFIVITLASIPSTFLQPQITIDPITGSSVDNNNMMILTGTTTLPIDSQITIKVSASPGTIAGVNATGKTTTTGYADIIPGAGGSNRWKGFVDISPLQPADYRITLGTVTYTENFSKVIESGPIAMQHFILGDEDAGPDSLRKKTVIKKPFIRMNAIDEPEPGSRERITGITSLQPGTPIRWTITEAGNKSVSGREAAKGITEVIPGMEGINRWSVVFNTTPLKPARYRVSITGDTGNSTREIDAEGVVSASSEFSLIPPTPGVKNTTSAIGNSSRFVTIDTLPDMQMNDIYLITGTTSLPAGEDLQVQVYSSAFMKDYNFTLDPKDRTQEGVSSGATGAFSGAGSTVRIVKGNGSENLWSFELRTYQMEPDVYVVNVCNDRYDTQLREQVPGDVSVSEKFTLKG